ncbi:MAG: glycosyltransferase [Dokdonella sp.]
MNDSTARIFCGADRSQQLPFEVLSWSIRRHASLPVEIRMFDNGSAPTPADPRHSAYTEFSFARFAIPALCGFEGKAVYIDSDMLVFGDIAELWRTPMQGARIAIEIGSRNQADHGKHAAVMLLDCARLDWHVDRIVGGLGMHYDYNALMAIDPLLEPGDMQERIASGWNDLDHFDPARTRNLHFTEIRTQPWVHAGHPHGSLWVDAVRAMLGDRSVSEAMIREEVALGHVRPSLLVELGLESVGGHDAAALQQYDHERDFVAHRRLLARFAARKHAIRRVRCDEASVRQPWFAPLYRLALRLRERREGNR